MKEDGLLLVKTLQASDRRAETAMSADLLVSLLNALLPLEEGRQVESIEYLQPELTPRTAFCKDTIVDVQCEETGGRKFIVEMQMNWRSNYEQRALFNAAKTYAGQLPKFRPGNFAEKKMQVLWLRFLTEIDEKTRRAPQELVDDPHVNEALELVEESAFSRGEILAYDKFWDTMSCRATARADAAIEKLRETVRQMRADGMDAGMIAKYTGLTAAEIAAVS